MSKFYNMSTHKRNQTFSLVYSGTNVRFLGSDAHHIATCSDKIVTIMAINNHQLIVIALVTISHSQLVLFILICIQYIPYEKIKLINSLIQLESFRNNTNARAIKMDSKQYIMTEYTHIYPR